MEPTDWNNLMEQLLAAENRIKEAHRQKKELLKKINNILIYQGYGSFINEAAGSSEFLSSLKARGLL